MFMGEYSHTIDAKGRMIIPAKFREELGKEFVLTKGLDGCLSIYPNNEWKAFEEKLAERPFARCNSGYLVNLAQVKSVQQGMVQVGPYELQVSRPRRKAFLAALADHIGGEGA